MASKKTKTSEENVAPEQRGAKPRKKSPAKEQKQEQEQQFTREKVTVFATVDENMRKAIEAAAVENGHLLVRLEEKVIDDFLAAKSAPTPEQNEMKQVENFIKDENNRAKAESDAKRLYSLLTRIPIEEFSGRKFNRKEVVKRTTLSHSGCMALLHMLEAFGYIKFTGGDYDEFEFEFRPDEIHRLIRRQAMAMLTECAKDLVRYKVLIENDKQLTEEQRKEEIASLEAEFKSLFA